MRGKFLNITIKTRKTFSVTYEEFVCLLTPFFQCSKQFCQQIIVLEGTEDGSQAGRHVIAMDNARGKFESLCMFHNNNLQFYYTFL